MAQADDPFDLDRFVEAQHGVFEDALAEIEDGQKSSHWMWFIFPQIEGLGSSPTARRFAIKSKAEAQAYLRHPVLGSRLQQCAEAAQRLQGLSVVEIFGYPDDMKLRSSATLFCAGLAAWIGVRKAAGEIFRRACRKKCTAPAARPQLATSSAATKVLKWRLVVALAVSCAPRRWRRDGLGGKSNAQMPRMLGLGRLRDVPDVCLSVCTTRGQK